MTNDTTVQRDFSDALKALRQGKRVRRLGWEQWLELPNKPHSPIFSTRGGIKVGWIVFQSDILATDWVVVEDVDGLYKPGV